MFLERLYCLRHVFMGGSSIRSIILWSGSMLPRIRLPLDLLQFLFCFQKWMLVAASNLARKRDEIELTSIRVGNRSLPAMLIDSSVPRRLAPISVVLVGILQADLDLHHHFVHLAVLKLMFDSLKGPIQFKRVCTYDNFARPGPKDSQRYHHTCALGSCIYHRHSVSYLDRIFHSSIRQTDLYNLHDRHIASPLECTFSRRIGNPWGTLEIYIYISVSVSRWHY